MVHVSTLQFFALHTLDPASMELWDHMNLCAYFELPARSSNYNCAYQELSTWESNRKFVVINFEGEQRRLQVNKTMLRHALNLPLGGTIDFFKLKHSYKDNIACFNDGNLVWDELKCQGVKLAF